MDEHANGLGGSDRRELTRRKVLGWGAAGLAAGLVPPSLALGQAAELPQGAINVITATVGGAGDVIMRIVGNKMTPIVGRPFALEPRAGAGGLVAGQFVARAKPDGMTLLFITGAHTILPGMHRKTTKFEAVDDFAFIGMISTTPFIIAVAQDHPAKSFMELIELSRKNPGKESFTTVGNGSTHQMIGMLLQRTFGVQWVEVPYRNAQQAPLDVIGGRVTISIQSAASVMPLLAGGQLRLLAVSQKPRMAQFPDVPALSEFPPGIEAGSYYGLAAPKGTPPAVVGLLNKALVAAVADPEVTKALEGLANIPQSSTPEEFRTRIASDVARWTKIIEELDLNP